MIKPLTGGHHWGDGGCVMQEMRALLNKRYPIKFERIEPMRDMGSRSYTAFASGGKYFLRVINLSVLNTAITGADIQVFLQNRDFPVPPIIFTNDNAPYVRQENNLYILYEFVEGDNVDPEQDAEAIGALVGKFHQEMKAYPGALIKRDKHFYIGRYIDILRQKHYPQTDAYVEYGDKLWENIKDLPRGYCHGDLYSGNIRKASNGKLYIHDFDTSCEGFPMYDPMLICDMTDYFAFDEGNFSRSNHVLARFLPEYRKYSTLSQAEVEAFHDLIAVQHFATQATIMGIFGLDCFDNTDMDQQLKWLYSWRKQCHGTR